MGMMNRQLHAMCSNLGNWDGWLMKLRFIMLEDEKVRVKVLMRISLMWWWHKVLYGKCLWPLKAKFL